MAENMVMNIKPCRTCRILVYVRKKTLTGKMICILLIRAMIIRSLCKIIAKSIVMNMLPSPYLPKFCACRKEKLTGKIIGIVFGDGKQSTLGIISNTRIRKDIKRI